MGDPCPPLSALDMFSPPKPALHATEAMSLRPKTDGRASQAGQRGLPRNPTGSSITMLQP